MSLSEYKDPRVFADDCSSCGAPWVSLYRDALGRSEDDLKMVRHHTDDCAYMAEKMGHPGPWKGREVAGFDDLCGDDE